jgi:four helix bundle protein
VGQSFKDLIAWQKAAELTVETYKLTAHFPDSERFGLTSQMRRSAVSIASNIAEGYGRSSRGEYHLFLGNARGSCCELETQIFVARKLGFGTASGLDAAEHLCNDVGRLLGALMKSIKPKRPTAP